MGFQRFPCLPPELRLQIWNDALSLDTRGRCRIFKCSPGRSDEELATTFFRHDGPPTLLHVCKESRQITLESCQRLVHLDSIFKCERTSTKLVVYVSPNLGLSIELYTEKFGSSPALEVWPYRSGGARTTSAEAHRQLLEFEGSQQTCAILSQNMNRQPIVTLQPVHAFAVVVCLGQALRTCSPEVSRHSMWRAWRPWAGIGYGFGSRSVV